MHPATHPSLHPPHRPTQSPTPPQTPGPPHPPASALSSAACMSSFPLMGAATRASSASSSAPRSSRRTMAENAACLRARWNVSGSLEYRAPRFTYSSSPGPGPGPGPGAGPTWLPPPASALGPGGGGAPLLPPGAGAAWLSLAAAAGFAVLPSDWCWQQPGLSGAAASGAVVDDEAASHRDPHGRRTHEVQQQWLRATSGTGRLPVSMVHHGYAGAPLPGQDAPLPPGGHVGPCARTYAGRTCSLLFFPVVEDGQERRHARRVPQGARDQLPYLWGRLLCHRFGVLAALWVRSVGKCQDGGSGQAPISRRVAARRRRRDRVLRKAPEGWGTPVTWEAPHHGAWCRIGGLCAPWSSLSACLRASNPAEDPPSLPSVPTYDTCDTPSARTSHQTFPQ